MHTASLIDEDQDSSCRFNFSRTSTLLSVFLTVACMTGGRSSVKFQLYTPPFPDFVGTSGRDSVMS
jgi:hypothetical protein